MTREHLSDLALDALRRTDETEGRDHLEGCARCRARQAELGAADDVFDARFVPAQLAAETLQAATTPRRRRWWPQLGFAAVAFAAAALVLIPRLGDDLRTKGAVSDAVTVYVLDPDRRVLAGPIAPRARLAVEVHGPGFGRVMWSSRPREWTALYPAADAPAWPVEAHEWLPNEVVLDGATEPEALGVVVCDTPFDVDAAREMLAADGTEPAPCRVQRVTIEKR